MVAGGVSIPSSLLYAPHKGFYCVCAGGGTFSLSLGQREDIFHSPQTCAFSVCAGLGVEREEVQLRWMWLNFTRNWWPEQT